MAAKIREGDFVEAVHGCSSDEEKPAERNARHAAEGLEPLKLDDKGKQGRVIKVFLVEGTVLVEGVNPKTRHARQGWNQAGDIETAKALTSLAKVALVDPDTKQRVRVGFRKDVVEYDDHTRKIRVHMTHGDMAYGIEQGKGV